MRQYIVGSWNNADEYDYSGEQVGNRQGSSVCVGHLLPNGKANLSRYADKEDKKAPIASRILPQNVTLNRLDTQQKELDEAYSNSEINEEEYEELCYALQLKRDRAHKSLCKAIGKPSEDEAIGELGGGSENASNGLKSQQYSSFLSKDRQGIEKNVKDDLKFFLLGAVICFSLLLWITN